MRPRYRLPRNRRYFHTKPKIDKRDMSILKRKIESIEQKNSSSECKKMRKKEHSTGGKLAKGLNGF